jgi:hypothetical protein
LAPERQKGKKTNNQKSRLTATVAPRRENGRYSAAKPAETLGFNQTESQLLNKYHCQENIISSVEIYELFKTAKTKKSGSGSASCNF